MTTWPRALRHGARRLRNAPGFTVTAILTLTLGLGALGTVFTVVYGVLLRPLPYPEPDRLVSVSHTLVVGGTIRVDQTDASLLFFGRHARAFEHFGGYRTVAAALAPVGGGDAERVGAALVTAHLLPALRVSPIRGRLLTDDDDRPDAPPVALLSEGLWRRKFGADPSIVGRPLIVDGVAREVVGVMPATFHFPAPETQLWLPLRLNPATTDSASFDYQGIGRLRAGLSRADAEQNLQALLTRLPDEFPGRLTKAAIEQTGMRVSVRPLADVVVGDAGGLLWVVFAAVAIVLGVSCANVTNLFLARAEARRMAVAVERALGASGRDIFRQFLVEGLLVAVAAGASATVVSLIAVQTLRSLGGMIDLPRLSEVEVDGTVVGVTAGIAVAAALLASAIPALRLARDEGSIQGSKSAPTVTAARQGVRHALVVAQVALALILLAGAGLLARSVWQLRAVSPGFDASHVSTFRVALPGATYPDAAASAAFFTRAVGRLAALPGVSHAAAVSKLPLDDQGRADSAVFLADRPLAPGTLPGLHPVIYATPDYFAAARIPLLGGRSFTPSDPPRVVLEAIVSRAFARRYWRDESPLGKRVRILTTGPWYTIVGEVGDVHDRALDRPVDELIYLPLLPPGEDRRWSPRDLALVVRSAGGAAAASGAVRDTLRSLDSVLPLYRVRSLEEIVGQASARRTVALAMVAAGALVAVALGAIGLYGVMAYLVTLRTREIAIRLALGAQPGAARRMIALQALRVAALGVAIGLVGAVAVTRFLSSLLYDVSPTDPAVLAASAALLTVVAAAASWGPTRRTASIDPAAALKAE